MKKSISYYQHSLSDAAVIIGNESDVDIDNILMVLDNELGWYEGVGLDMDDESIKEAIGVLDALVTTNQGDK